MHFYNFNIGDYAKKTQHLTNEEDLAYRRLLDLYYDIEAPITHGLATLTRRLRVSEKALQNVLDEFFPGGRNKHADEEIAKYYAYLEKQKANGIKGGRPKHKPTANPPVSQNNPPPSQPLTKEPGKPKVKSIAPSDRFDPVAYLKKHGVSESVAKDWLVIRKTKKAPPTETALSMIVREAEKAGISMHDAITRCCQNSWAGFKASWKEGEVSHGNASTSDWTPPLMPAGTPQ